MWPTMLAIVAERFRRGGSLFIGLMSSMGAASTYLVLPQLGRIYDQARIANAGGVDAFATLKGASLQQVLVSATAASFRAVAVLPVILILAFAVIWVRERTSVDATLGRSDEQIR
jgi:hypothetical protein